MIKRILAWIALIFFLLIVANILFIHVYVTESVTIFLIYVLVVYFGRNRRYETGGLEDGEMGDQPAEPETAPDSETGGPEQLE